MSLLPPTSPFSAPAPHGFPPSLSTSLTDWPEDATFQILRKPVSGITPVSSGKAHIGDLIPSEGTFLLVSIEDINERLTINRELMRGQGLGIQIIVVGNDGIDFIASALYSSGNLMSQHGLTHEPRRATLFVPSPSLLRLLRINHPQRTNRTRNALILIQEGRVRASWVSGGDGQEPHNWTTIEAALQSNAAK